MRVEIEEKRFSEKLVFSSFSHEFREGEITIVRGISGSGKTTLLRIMAGLDKDFKGQVVGVKSPLFLFQEDRLVTSLSSLSNLLSVTSDKKKAKDILSSLNLKGEERTIVREMSGGMRRRVAIARVLLLPGETVFLDEPFRALDEENERNALSLILSAFRGKTIIIASHSSIYGLEDCNYLNL